MPISKGSAGRHGDKPGMENKNWKGVYIAPIQTHPTLPGMHLDTHNRSVVERIRDMSAKEQEWLKHDLTRWMLLPHAGALAEVVSQGFLPDGWATQKAIVRMRELIDQHQEGGNPDNVLIEVWLSAGNSLWTQHPIVQTMVGRVWIRGISSGSGDLGLLFDPRVQSRGIGKITMEQVIAYAFRSTDAGGLALGRLSFGTFEDNIRMNKLAKRYAFKPYHTTERFRVWRTGPRKGTRQITMVRGVLYELIK